MLTRLAPAVTCAAFLASAAAAQAQPQTAPAPAQTAAPPSTSVAPLTVQAAPAPAIVRKEARNFVQSYTSTTPAIGQTARWKDPICITVAGLAPDQAAQVADRIQQVAKGVGMHILKPGCRANIQVVFTDDPQRVMDQVAAHREEILGYYHRHDLKALKTVTRPIQAWYVTSTAGGLGHNAGVLTAVVSGPQLGGLSVQANDEVVDDPENTGPTGCADAPHFTRCLRSNLVNVFVVVDTSRLKGQDLGAVSDYLSMLTLSQPRSLDGCAALSSVIDMLAPTCPGRETPGGLTPADAAYLTALYASDLQANEGGEQDEIAARMAKILIAGKSGR